MAFPQPFLDALTERNPIDEVVGQYVSLTRRGSNLFGLCPFHSEKTASFSVAPDKGIFYCFGCHAGGGVINFIMQIEGLDYPDAVRFLAKRAGLEVPEDENYHSQYQKQERLWALCKDAARFFRQQLFSPVGTEAQAYIQKRALSMETVKRFGLGFSPNAWASLTDAMKEKGYKLDELIDAGLALRGKNGGVYDRFRNRLMFPIIDIRNNIIGFGGRVMDDSTPKYLNSPETIIFNKRKNLFALNIARKSKQGRIILTEGYMDAIALHQYGFDCAVASLGTSLTEEHANILAKYTNQVILTYDGDEAGQNATRRAIPMLEKTGIQVRVLRMQGAKDPDEFLKKYGAQRFEVLLDACQNQAEYRLDSLKRKYRPDARRSTRGISERRLPRSSPRSRTRCSARSMAAAQQRPPASRRKPCSWRSKRPTERPAPLSSKKQRVAGSRHRTPKSAEDRAPSAMTISAPPPPRKDSSACSCASRS